MTQQALSIRVTQELSFTMLTARQCMEVYLLWWTCWHGLKGKAVGQDKPITPSSPQPHTCQERQHTSQDNRAFWSSATHWFAAFIYFQMSYGTEIPFGNACGSIQRRKGCYSMQNGRRIAAGIGCAVSHPTAQAPSYLQRHVPAQLLIPSSGGSKYNAYGGRFLSGVHEMLCFSSAKTRRVKGGEDD